MSKKPKQVDIPRASLPLDPTVYVILEGCDGTRIVADRNCVAVSRRLADLIPPLITPPQPPPAPARGGKKDEAPPPPPVNRGMSKVSPLFETDLGPGHPAPLSSVVFGQQSKAAASASAAAAAAAAASSSLFVSNGESSAAAAAALGAPVATAIVPVVKVDCLDGRQLEAAMRIAHLKYMGDNMETPAQRRTVSLEALGVSADELMAIGTILGL